jgi:hypothetical protein
MKWYSTELYDPVEYTEYLCLIKNRNGIWHLKWRDGYWNDYYYQVHPESGEYEKEVHNVSHFAVIYPSRKEDKE